MDPNTAFVMALLALIVSVGGFLLSAATFWRNRAPRPRWVTGIKIRTDPDDGERRVTGYVENRGRGVALDVTFEPEGAGPIGLFAQRKEDRAEYGKKLDITMVHDAESFGTGRFVLTWYQEPRVHRKRTKRMKYKLKAIPVPAAE